MSDCRDTVYFLSDAHFGLAAGEHERVRLFADLAAEASVRATDLYILGDLFDFWIEYRHAIRPDYFNILHILRGLTEAGVSVHYLTGNHDFALGPFLEEEIGITVTRGAVNATLQGRAVHLRHGDDIAGGNALSPLLRNKFLQSAYKIIHPSVGVGIGKYFSAMSRKKHLGKMSDKDLEKYRQAARAYLKNGLRDLVIFAHTHHAELLSLDGGEYCNTGSWMKDYSYAVLRDGKIQLLKWGENGGGGGRQDAAPTT
jgi:UDP-2,3-diacylglucosamine hydrolase